MRCSELEGKEVIELSSGARLGIIKESELLLNLKSGMVEGLILRQTGFGGIGKQEQNIPWKNIRKISEELIIVDGCSGGSAKGEFTKEP
ncbi:MAG TPA: YlmC/YmxH family sporulation protein [Bacillota bacterium]|nr:YlmC/YmxH family sporulation protein [Bacillota bacterium]